MNNCARFYTCAWRGREIYLEMVKTGISEQNAAKYFGFDESNFLMVP